MLGYSYYQPISTLTSSAQLSESEKAIFVSKGHSSAMASHDKSVTETALPALCFSNRQPVQQPADTDIFVFVQH